MPAPILRHTNTLIFSKKKKRMSIYMATLQKKLSNNPHFLTFRQFDLFFELANTYTQITSSLDVRLNLLILCYIHELCLSHSSVSFILFFCRAHSRLVQRQTNWSGISNRTKILSKKKNQIKRKLFERKGYNVIISAQTAFFVPYQNLLHHKYLREIAISNFFSWYPFPRQSTIKASTSGK
jgi:hypothetical protein